MLVDTGFPPTIVEASRQPGHKGPRVGEDDLIVNQLARLGVRPQDVGYLVASHSDLDQAGNLQAFPDAEIVVQRAHYQAAREGVALIVYGHDAEEWEKLKKAPEFYT